MQVVKRLANGMTGPQIAQDLHVGYEAVRNYLRRARRKTGCHTQAQLEAFASWPIEEEETLP